MSDNKKFFDMSPTQSLVFGLVVGIAAVSLIGFVILLIDGKSAIASPGVNSAANVNAAVNVNAAPVAAPEAAADISKISPVTSADHIRGGTNAKVTLVAFSDFQCPYCQNHEETLAQLLKQYGDKIRVVWRNFPLTSLHPYAQKAAEAAECAGDQGKFWEMHDKIFSNQSAITVNDLKGYAADLGLNTSTFNSCLDSGKNAAKIAKQQQEAEAAGITGTPGTFVGSQLVKGAYPIGTFTAIIDGLLK